MVALKPQDADKVVAAPPASVCFFLVYGPDTGLVAERAGRIAAARADPQDPFSLIKLDASTLAADPSRLADEAYAVSMFGGRRAIVVRDAGSRATLAESLAALMRQPPAETTIVVEGGDLKKSNPIRALFERDKQAYAIACYEDDAGAVARLVEEEMRDHGLRIAPAAKALLVDSLGGDRLLTRSEIRKLCLYAGKSGEVTVEDVIATVVDTAGVAVDEIVDATATGDLEALETALGRAGREGLDPSWIASTVLRHFHQLDIARAAVDAGASVDEAVTGMRPPVFFKRKAAVTQAVRTWSAGALARALARLSTTARDARLDASLGRDILADTLIALARYAAGGGRGR